MKTHVYNDNIGPFVFCGFSVVADPRLTHN